MAGPAAADFTALVLAGTGAANEGLAAPNAKPLASASAKAVLIFVMAVPFQSLEIRGSEPFISSKAWPPRDYQMVVKPKGSSDLWNIIGSQTKSVRKVEH